MENVYSKFFSPGYGTSSFNSYYTPQKSFNKVAHIMINDNMSHVRKNNINNFFEKNDKLQGGVVTNSAYNNIQKTPQLNPNNTANPKGQLIKTIEGNYKYIPEEVNFTGPNPVRPVKFQDSDFSSFDTYTFQNSQQKPVPETNFSPTVMQVQMLSEKVKNIERNHAEERSQLLNVIKSQILNPITQEDLRETKRKNAKGKLERLKTRYSQDFFDEDDDEEIQEKQRIRSTQRANIHKDAIRANSNSNNILDKIIIVPTSKPPVILNDSEIVARTLQEIKDEIFSKMQEESLRNQESLSKLSVNFRGLKDEIFTKIEYMNHKQKLNIENFRYCLERSGIPRMKLLTRKIFDGEDINIDEEDPEDEGGENANKKGGKTTKNKSKENPEGNQTNRRGGLELNLPLDTDPNEDNRLIDYVENKKTNNAQIEKDLEGNENEIIDDIDKLRKEKVKGLKEKLINKQKLNNERLKFQADKFKNKEFNMKPINLFRKYVYTIMVTNKFLNIVYLNNHAIKSQSLNMFISSFEAMNTALNNWVFNSIRTPYLSILNTPNLDIDLSSYGPLNANVSKSAEDVYIRLEIRISGFIKSLIDQESFDKIDKNLITYLSLLVSNNAYIPKEFFTLFEYSRIKTENNELKNINEKQMQMILGVYIICKILCKNVLYDHSLFTGNAISGKIKSNFNMCSSIIYRTAIEYFKANCPVIRKVTNILTYNDSTGENKNNNKHKRVLYDLNKKPQGVISKSYLEACENYADKDVAIQPLLKKSDEKILSKILQKIPKFYPDTDDKDIEVINNQMLSSRDLVGFNNMAAKYKFDLSKLIVEFLDKLINILEVNKI